MKKLCSVLVATALCLTIGSSAMATVSTNEVLSSEEYHSALNQALAEYGITIYLEEENPDFVYTQAYLDESIEYYKNSLSISIEIDDLEDEAVLDSEESTSNNQTTRLMPCDYSWSQNKSITVALGDTATGRLTFRAKVTGRVNVDTGEVMSHSGSLSVTRSINVLRYDLDITTEKSGSNKVKVGVTGEIAFKFTNVNDGNIYKVERIGAFLSEFITPENEI